MNRRCARRAIALAMLVMALALSSCTGGGSVAEQARSTAATASKVARAAPPKISRVALRGAKLTVVGRNGSLSGTVDNTSTTAYRVTAITCACASRIQLGAVTKGKVSPVAGGLALPPMGSLVFGNGKVTVALSDLLPVVKAGARLPVIVYFADRGSITGSVLVG